MTQLSLHEAKDILTKTAKRFYKQSWMLGTSGNLSICLTHEPLQYVITASGYDKGELQPEHFVVLSENQTPVEPNNQKPSAETALHEAIYKLLPDTQAVYHVHTVAATVLSRRITADSIVFEGYEMLKGLGTSTHETSLSLPIIDNTQDIASLADELEDYLEHNVPGFILRGHGLYTWGRTPQEAKQRIECWEFLFQCKMQEH